MKTNQSHDIELSAVSEDQLVFEYRYRLMGIIQERNFHNQSCQKGRNIRVRDLKLWQFRAVSGGKLKN